MNLKTRVRSTIMRYLASPGALERQRAKARKRRATAGEPAAVHYFHQVDDPYSHLAVQKLDALRSAYGLPFRAHLVSGPPPEYQGSSAHFGAWALRDAQSIAACYGTQLQASHTPAPAEVAAANEALARELTAPGFAELAFATGQALWSGTLAGQPHPDGLGTRAVHEGDALRRKLGHYLGAMFHFDGEWFWGVDRIRALEQRLVDEGFGDGSGTIRVPEPTPRDTTGMNTRGIELEYFPSLRSPYTAIGHQRVLDLIERSGVTVRLRPVMPMMMRGIPAPRAKQRYIITDAAREARARNVPFGRIVDPFGEPVKRAFALFAGAEQLDRGMAFVSAYLAAAWAEGVDIASAAGLRRVAERAGLDWEALNEAAAGSDWTALLDDNLNAMLAAGLWGVPSFRVSGGSIDTPFACWGQDRIWRVENEIAERI